MELAKIQIGEGGQRAEDTRAVLGHVLDVVLRLLHPVTPFVTEALWTALTGRESIVTADWPAAVGREADAGAAQRIEDVQKLVTEVRRFRYDQGLKPGQRVKARFAGLDDAHLTAHEPAVRTLTRLDTPADAFTGSAALEVGLSSCVVTVELDMLGAVDVAAERKRLSKDLAAAEKDLKASKAKLANPEFTAKAPAEVVAKIQARRQAAAADIERLTARLATLPA